MRKIKLRSTNIFCLESMWSRRLNHPKQSILPLLEILKNEYGINFAHFNCNTIEEFKYNLSLINKRFGIIYFAFHGEPGKILLPAGKISLNDISSFAGNKLINTAVHFASCSTLNIKSNDINAFLKSTKSSIVTGYIKDVFWVQTASIDLVYLDALVANFPDVNRSIEYLYKSIAPSETIGFRYFTKE